MTPAARVSAAIEVLDIVLSGTPVEKALTNWGRQNRYAGSKDRAAVRDHVFDAFRCLRSCAAIGGAMTGRGVMLGALTRAGEPIQDLFSGERFAPQPLTASERDHLSSSPDMSPDVAVDCPEWLWPIVQEGCGDRAAEIFAAQQSRAPVFLRVNALKAAVADAQASLALDGIETGRHPTQVSALVALSNPRRIQQSTAYETGLVELQDASSQAIADFVPVEPGQEVLDYCAGGGGKTLAFAGRVSARYSAHDIDPRRLAPIEQRAARAGATVLCVATLDLPKGPAYDGVLCDVPCSGSGSWRRSPEGKWTLTQSRLDDLLVTQAQILDAAAALVRPGGWLVHATCSVLKCENQDQVTAFLDRHPGWSGGDEAVFFPGEQGDGLFARILLKPGD